MQDAVHLDPRKPADHVTMMKSPDLWPLGAVLALKRPKPVDLTEWPPEDVMVLSDNEELGVLVSVEGVERYTVLRLSLFDQRLRSVLFRGEIPSGVSFYDYMDAEGVFDAGWRVD